MDKNILCEKVHKLVITQSLAYIQYITLYSLDKYRKNTDHQLKTSSMKFKTY